MAKVHLIVVTGNIGSGKTTTLRQIQTWAEDDEQFTIIFEDVKSWAFYLRKFYETYQDEKDERRNEFGFLLQMQILFHYHSVTQKLQHLQDQCDKSGKDHYVFVERSPFDAKEVFVDTNKEIYTKRQYDLLAGLVEEYTHLWMWKNATYIQIVTPKEVCLQRIGKRARGGENNITLDYLAQLQEAYAQLAYKIDMKTLSVGINETPECVARSVLRLVDVEGRLFEE